MPFKANKHTQKKQNKENPAPRNKEIKKPPTFRSESFHSAGTEEHSWELGQREQISQTCQVIQT